MNNKDLLDDDLDWDAEISNWTEEADAETAPVTMLHTFNTEQEADLAVALLASEGIVARVVSSITGGMTPFAYGNVRLFVAAGQAAAAADVLRNMTGQNVPATDKKTAVSAMHVLIVLVLGLFVMGLIVRFLQQAFSIG